MIKNKNLHTHLLSLIIYKNGSNLSNFQLMALKHLKQFKPWTKLDLKLHELTYRLLSSFKILG